MFLSFRHGDVNMHKFSPAHKNEFLKDLDKQDVLTIININN